MFSSYGTKVVICWRWRFEDTYAWCIVSLRSRRLKANYGYVLRWKVVGYLIFVHLRLHRVVLHCFGCYCFIRRFIEIASSCCDSWPRRWCTTVHRGSCCGRLLHSQLSIDGIHRTVYNKKNQFYVYVGACSHSSSDFYCIAVVQKQPSSIHGSSIGWYLPS